MLASATQTIGMAFVVVLVADDADHPVAGASVTSDSTSIVRYDGQGQIPTSDATTTGTDGIAYLFDAAPGTVKIEALAPGFLFATQSVVGRADQVTLTVIHP
jgi:hypothetical protein